MSTQVTQENQENKPNDKELNFRALQAKYEKELAQERAARQEAEKIAEERTKMAAAATSDDDDYSEPYVDHKKLKKEQAKFGQQLKQETLSEVQKAVQVAREQERQEMWLEQNPDFYSVLQNNADKLAQKSPVLAKSILNMPDNFERQKLVYQTIKELGLDKPEVKQASIQEKIDANRRSPYYQPSGVANAPYQNAGDFSEGGQKNAYEKMKDLQKRLRI
jgi:hypothetical protein